MPGLAKVANVQKPKAKRQKKKNISIAQISGQAKLDYIPKMPRGAPEEEEDAALLATRKRPSSVVGAASAAPASAPQRRHRGPTRTDRDLANRLGTVAHGSQALRALMRRYAKGTLSADVLADIKMRFPVEYGKILEGTKTRAKPMTTREGMLQLKGTFLAFTQAHGREALFAPGDDSNECDACGLRHILIRRRCWELVRLYKAGKLSDDCIRVLSYYFLPFLFESSDDADAMGVVAKRVFGKSLRR